MTAAARPIRVRTMAMPGGSDKIVHFLVFGLLATLTCRLGRGWKAAFWALLATSLIRDASGGPAYLVSQVQDITERRRNEAWMHELVTLNRAVALSKVAGAEAALALIEPLADRRVVGRPFALRPATSP